ncbi:Neuroglian [Hypsibius exemplaris]|uniref:Neuroglian n=1 Tax=Hypsibius exemplaris TaxID=2072580 RepID=A0A1W0WUQ2_HYPEX|nr:Neuroglian [Hypsibius exemplaris]
MRSRMKLLTFWEPPPFCAIPSCAASLSSTSTSTSQFPRNNRSSMRRTRSLSTWWTVAVAVLCLASSAVAVTSPPYMVRQPPHELLYQISSPNREDRPVILDCEAKGDPLPEYRWTKNGQDFATSGSDDRVAQDPGKGTLTIHRPKDIDEGLYQCFAENSYGISLSNAVYLRRAGLDTFRTEDTPEEIVVDEGQQLTIKCNPPNGNPRPNVFWILQSTQGAMTTVNGSRISVDVEGDLHFSNITLDDASGDKYYACSAFSPFLREYKTGELKKLIVRPSGQAAPNKVAPVCQYTSPKHLTGMRGQNIDISCIYGGTPLPQVKWHRKGAELPPRRSQYSDYGKVLRLKNLQFEDQGTYECSASNGVGIVQAHAFTLTVESDPYWITAPEVAMKAEDEDQTFACLAGGVPEPRIQWFVNGTPYENLPANPRRTTNGTHITIRTVQKDIDTDNYQCNASNAHGYIFADVYMNVLALPAEIVEPPAEVSETVEGATAVITCRVYGAPRPRVSWEKDGQTINVQPGGGGGGGGRYEIKKEGDLLVKGATFTDIGSYTCIAVNRFGEKRASGRLDIKRKTVVTAPPEDVERRAGESATFRCSATSDPTLETTIEWLRDGEPIKMGQNGRIFQNNDNSLTISEAQEVHSGMYTCIARTRLDTSEAHATLIVRDVPNPPVNVRVQCSAREAVVHWEPNGDNREPIFEFIIQYSTSFEPGEWKDIKTDIAGTDLSSSVELSPWVNYTFRVRAKNRIGLSNASAPSQEVCTTPPDVPFKNPDNVQGRGDTPNNLVISWTPMPQIDHNGPGFYYEVKWLPVNPDPIAQRVEQSEIITDWQKGSLTVPNVPTYVPFDVKVVAGNALGPSKAANAPPVRGFSGENIPTEAPKKFYLSELVNGKTARVEWEPVAADSIHGDFKGYKIIVQPEGDEKPREIRVGPNATTAIVDVLKPASKNTVTVQPYNGQYDGPVSEPLVFETPEGAPGRVSDLRAYPMGRGAIFLEWKPPAEPNGKLLSYEIEIKEVDGLAVSEPIREPTIITDLNQNAVKLAGLKPDTKYRIELAATTAAGKGETGIVESATDSNRTMEAMALLPPPGVPDFVLSGKTNESIIVSWQPQSAAGGGHRIGEHFFVEHRRKGDGEWSKTKDELNGLSTEIFGLDPGTTYEVRVVAVEGDHQMRGPIHEVTTEGERVGEAPSPYGFASYPWFIALMCLLALLLLICLIVCVVRRSKRGGKYAVNEGDRSKRPASYDYEKAPTIPQGLATNNLPKVRPNDGGINGDENASIISREGGGSEADSMEEYGDPDQPKMFSEDGSWIGQYASNTVRSNDAVVSTTVAQHPTGSTFV